MIPNLHLKLGHFPLIPQTFIPIAYLRTPFEYRTYILNLTYPNSSSLFCLLNFLYPRFSLFFGCYPCFQGMTENHPCPTSFSHSSHPVLQEILLALPSKYTDSDYFFLPPCPKPLSFLF